MAKIRAGFVSNSSSSSFLIFGFYINNENLYKKLQDKYYKAFDFYCGDEEGYVMGVDPINFLSREKFDDASKSALLYIQDLMDENDFKELMEDVGVKEYNNNIPALIYDSYYS